MFGRQAGMDERLRHGRGDGSGESRVPQIRGRHRGREHHLRPDVAHLPFDMPAPARRGRVSGGLPRLP